MSGEIEVHGGPLPPAWRQREHGIESIPERWPRGRDLPDRSGGPGFTRPDFVLTGARLPDGRFRMIASREMHYAELNADFGYTDIGDVWDPRPIMTHSAITLTARLGNLLMVDGPDYATCMAEVARHWQET